MSIPTTLQNARKQFQGAPFEPPRPSATERYRTESRGIEPLIDVYLPETPGPHRSVVIIHGGGFVVGSRTMTSVVWLVKQFIARGFACAAFDYRMVFRGGRVPQAVDDTVAALAWWRAAASRFDLDPTAISVLGMSAGGALMSLAVERVPGPFERLIGIYAVSDFTKMKGGKRGFTPRVLFGTSDPDELLARSPHNLTRCPAPLGLFHGTSDTLVDIAHARGMAQQRRARELPVHEVYYANQGHGFLQYDHTCNTSLWCLEDVLAFLEHGTASASEVLRTEEMLAAPPPDLDLA